MTSRRVAIIDNAVDHRLYAPVDHWAPRLPVPWTAFEARSGRLPRRAEGFSHIILTGSEASILERETWAEDEAGFVREALESGAAVLGSCWGHQLLAYSLLGPDSVGRCRRPEIGWIAVDVVRASEFIGRRRRVCSFSLHFDEVADTGGLFEVLASSPSCAVQAMALVDGRAWGFQIHPEIDAAAAKALLAGSLGLNHAAEPLFRAALRSRPRDSGLIRRIVRSFLDS